MCHQVEWLLLLLWPIFVCDLVEQLLPANSADLPMCTRDVIARKLYPSLKVCTFRV